jgi:hypothetical protein
MHPHWKSLLAVYSLVSLGTGLLATPALAATEKQTFQLGDTSLALTKTWFHDPDHGLYLILHENETTARQAALDHIQKYGGIVLALEGQGKRDVAFSLAGKTWVIDPNRIFTARGIEQTLDANNPSSWRKNQSAVMTAVHTAAQIILTQIGPAAAVIAVHNNLNHTAKDFLQDPLTAGICWAGGKKTHEFYYVTCWKDYTALGAQGYTVIWQDAKKAASGQGDGSLSDFCGQRGIRYINVEAAFASSGRQRQMLEAADLSLASASYAVNRESAKRFSKWMDETLAAAQNRPVLIADKFAYCLLFFKQGKLQRVIPMALGQNPVQIKQQEGDACTPEGHYHIVRKLPHSQYYKAFLIDYPNAEDRARFQAAKQRGEIAAPASIGGLVEIHGRGIGRNWTLGCMALDDKDMDQLWPDITLSTPVTIVGYLPASAKITARDPK